MKSANVYIDNKKYFHYLNSETHDNLMNSLNKGNFYVSRDFITKKQVKTKIYTTFRDHFEFRKVLRETEENDRNFYEIIPENVRRKAYFDLDIKRDPERFPDLQDFAIFSLGVVNNLVKTAVNLHPFLKPENFIILCNDNPEIKASFHLIINGYYFEGVEKCRSFCINIIEKVMELHPEYSGLGEILDRKVYCKNQNFRMLMNKKIEGQELTLWNPWPYFGEEIESIFYNQNEYTQFYDTLITATTECIKYPCDPETQKKREIYSSVEFGNNSADDILKIINERYGECYTIREVKGGLISLNRIKGKKHKCEACEVSHQNENPFVVVYGGHVWFDCNRRTDKKRTKICENTFTTGETIEDEEIEFPKNVRIIKAIPVFNWIPEGYKIKAV